MSKLYLEIFDPERIKIFKKLSNFKENGFLAGGTSLALQIGHRKSFDFDVFLPKPISKQFFNKVAGVYGTDISTRISTSDLLLIRTPSNIEVHYVYYWYPSIHPKVKTGIIDLASICDIAADKAFTIGQRGQWRDYVDIFFLIKRGIANLPEIIKLASSKYKPEFNPRLFLEQLTYFKDIDNFKIEFLNESYEIEEIKHFLEEEVKKFNSANL